MPSPLLFLLLSLPLTTAFLVSSSRPRSSLFSTLLDNDWEGSVSTHVSRSLADDTKPPFSVSTNDLEVKSRKQLPPAAATFPHSASQMPLWQIFRELQRRKVPHRVIDSREALEELLIQARAEQKDDQYDNYLSKASEMPYTKLKDILDKNGVAATSGEPKKKLERRFADLITYYNRANSSTFTVPSPSAAQVSPALPPPSPLGGNGLFKDRADALKWCLTLDSAAIRVELEFLGLDYPKDASKPELAQRLADELLAEQVLHDRRRRRRASRIGGSPSNYRIGLPFDPYVSEEIPRGRERVNTPANKELEAIFEQKQKVGDGIDYLSDVVYNVGVGAWKAFTKVKNVGKEALVNVMLSVPGAESAASETVPRRPVARRRRFQVIGLLGKLVVQTISSGMVVSSSWAGAGLIPPRYVLAMVMTSAILLRRGFTGLLISLLVVRAGSHILLILRDEQHRVSSVDRDDLWEREGFKPPPTRTASTNT